MQTLSALMSNTPNQVRKRAAGQCSGSLSVNDLSFADRLRGRKGTKFRELRFSVTCTTGVRACSIRFYDGGKVERKSQVWVTCSCPYWKFYCEVAVASTGSASIVTSNGQAPKIRNPSMDPYLCKHLYRAGTDGVKAVVDSELPESFFYEQTNKKTRDLLDQRQELFVPINDTRPIPWAGDPTGQGGSLPIATAIDWNKPMMVTIPASMRSKTGGRP